MPRFPVKRHPEGHAVLQGGASKFHTPSVVRSAEGFAGMEAPCSLSRWRPESPCQRWGSALPGRLN